MLSRTDSLKLAGMAMLHALLPSFMPRKNPKAFHSGSSGTLRNLFSISYDGEKNLGELGPPRDYLPDYDMLRIRSWQAMIESEIALTVLNKFNLWIIGAGLKLQANPVKLVLSSEKIDIGEEFNEMAEARFLVWSRSRQSDYAGMVSLNTLAKRAFKNAKVGGDVLVILRYVKGSVRVQLVDGAHVCSPGYGDDSFALAKENGNVIRNGIELSPAGEHVAYYVRTATLKYERIEARSKSTGIITAFMVYGNEFRLDNTRGLPLIAACLETLKKLERYKEAAVGSAEERQKIVYQIVHQQFSTGETPLAKQLSHAFDADANDDLPTDINGTELANTVAATTNKSTYNMPIGAEMKALESKNEMFFKEFYSTNSDIICAAVGIPPNVAFSIYNDSFSASRAATKDWEHTILVNRDDFSAQFYQNIYNFWLHTEVLTNKLDAPGYLEAFAKKNNMVLSAYQDARFTGPMFPHIDPEKEARAQRLLLGTTGAHIPLTTVERATEIVGGGDSDANMAQYADELEESETLGIKPEPPAPPEQEDTDEKENPKPKPKPAPKPKPKP